MVRMGRPGDQGTAPLRGSLAWHMVEIAGDWPPGLFDADTANDP